MDNYFRGITEEPVGFALNFSRLSFNYFIAQHNGIVVGSAKDEDSNEFIYAIEQDGGIRIRKNQGIWRQLPDRDAASLRYYTGRYYNRDEHVPTYYTRCATV